jgi:hypothetical protein
MRANGGNGVNLGGGGGGGRITVLSQTNQFSGSMTAYGGGGAAYGGAGTIYLGSSSYGKPSTNQLIIDNGGRSGTNTSLGTTQFGTIDLDLINGAVLGLRGPLLLDNLLIGSNSWLYVTNTTLGAMVATLTVAGNAQIQAGGGIIADATGPFGGQGEGPGRLATTPGAGSSGGGNGGYGASTTVPGGPAYGNATGGTSPVGSGGGNAYPTQTGGGSGGGAVQMTVTGLLQVDGRISADGGSGFVQQAGGGSGGGILLTVGGLTGTGLISASGGPGAGLGGGGGGGRVTVAYRSNYFTGTLKATGAGSGTNFGGAGTIYTRLLTQQSGQLMADNGGNPGSLTLVPDASVSSLVVQGGASVVTTYRNFTMASLLVGTNSWIVASNRSEIDVTGVATIQMGGGLMGDGRGYLAQGGPGAGYSSTQVAGGGGYGGNGGANPLSTGNSYGSMIGENQIGSGGGSLTNVKPTGGAGGGYVAFGGFGTLILNGIISDNGMGGSQNGAGGSGGSVYLNVSTLAGSGQIMANGGAGDPLANAGGGGGGRIALYYRTNTFAGSVVAKGGAGTVAGGAGTIYWHLVGQPSGSVLVDNAGQVGASTPVKNIGAFDLTVSGGAVAYPASSFLILSNLLVSSGAMMTSGPGQTNLQLSILSNLVVDADSGVVVDGMGFSQALGPGAGQSAYGDGSGAGYGGFGGDSMTAPGGISYGSATIPVDLGSGGGFGSGPTYVGGSAGGGAIHLDIGGNLTVNGWLSANGNPGLQDNSGGGSGGSVWVNSRALYGYGYVLADGGDGELYGGGGGSGGRIAIYHLRNTIHTNTFTGTIAAYGGQGDSWGDDGSIFLASTSGGLRVLGQTPVGATEASVGAMTVTFDGAVNPFSAANANVTLTTPVGVLTSNSLAFSLADPYTLIISFSQQSAPGLYTLYLGPQITDLFGQPLAQAYTGTFSIVLPSVSGTVTDTNGNPVAGVLMQPDGPWSSSTTDNQGKYSISVVSGTFLTVTPSYTNNMFLPKARTYSGVTGSVTNENYTMVSTIAPYLQVGRQDGNLTLSWYGLLGVSYYVQSSTNLVNWVQDGYPVLGTNGVMVVPLPIGTDPNTFFRIQAFN